MASGLTLVGERGPELVDLPQGSKVHSNYQSRRMLASSSGITINNVFTGNTLMTERDIRKFSDMVGASILRQVQFEGNV